MILKEATTQYYRRYHRQKDNFVEEDHFTLMYSMGHTAVASIPPATHPAAMGRRGFFFFSLVGMLLELDGDKSMLGVLFFNLSMWR
jgi:hypothetical protein